MFISVCKSVVLCAKDGHLFIFFYLFTTPFSEIGIFVVANGFFIHTRREGCKKTNNNW